VNLCIDDVKHRIALSKIYIPPSNFWVSPFLGVSDKEPIFTPNYEVGKLIEVSMESMTDSFVIKVKDKGIGIPVDEQPYIFTRFYRSSNASNIQGTGLGLAIVDRYVRILGGKITFQSKEGDGSIFEVKLPKKNGKEDISN